jgi:ribonucleoside-diphosphate reductase beta chain
MQNIAETRTLYKAVNWNKLEDFFTQDFWDQNVAQFWLDKDFPVSDDQIVWESLEPVQRDVYSKVLLGLTSLDTKQTNTGMPVISLMTVGEQRKAVLNFMGAMEAVHAKSYSSIFTTLLTQEEINKVFTWGENQLNLQRKTEIIDNYYKRALLSYVLGTLTVHEYFMALVASVFLESFLFYSGFFYPLYLTGQGKMTSSGEVIGLIIRDESIHGLLIGLYAQEAFALIPEEEKQETLQEVYTLLHELYENEIEYTKEIYTQIGLVEEVTTFLQYNADKALMTLGLPVYFNVTDSDINPIILNGINTSTVNHDFFSVRGNGYILALNVEKIRDEHFVFDIADEFGDIDCD